MTAIYAKVDLARLRPVGPPLAWSGPMNFRQQADDYLALRRALGHDLSEAGRLLLVLPPIWKRLAPSS